MKCSKCGEEMVELPEGNYRCPKCNFMVNDLVLRSQVPMSGTVQFGGKEGWVCPKCGKSISPYEKTCPFCDGPSTTNIGPTVTPPFIPICVNDPHMNVIQKGKPVGRTMAQDSDVKLVKCEACGKMVPEDTTGVCSSVFGPISFRYCANCLAEAKEPYWAMVAYVSCAGHFPQDINEIYQAEVRRQLKLHGKTEEEFIKDVDKAIEEEGNG